MALPTLTKPCMQPLVWRARRARRREPTESLAALLSRCLVAALSQERGEPSMVLSMAMGS